jgi:hypothetical protein
MVYVGHTICDERPSPHTASHPTPPHPNPTQPKPITPHPAPPHPPPLTEMMKPTQAHPTPRISRPQAPPITDPPQGCHDMAQERQDGHGAHRGRAMPAVDAEGKHLVQRSFRDACPPLPAPTRQGKDGRQPWDANRHPECFRMMTLRPLRSASKTGVH